MCTLYTTITPNRPYDCCVRRVPEWAFYYVELRYIKRHLLHTHTCLTSKPSNFNYLTFFFSMGLVHQWYDEQSKSPRQIITKIPGICSGYSLFNLSPPTFKMPQTPCTPLLPLYNTIFVGFFG